MVENPAVSFVSSYTEGIKRVRESNVRTIKERKCFSIPQGTYAFAMEATANDFTNARLPCDTYRMPGPLMSQIHYGIAVRRGSPFKYIKRLLNMQNCQLCRLKLDIALERMRETNDLVRLKRKWWVDKAQCPEQGAAFEGIRMNVSLIK